MKILIAFYSRTGITRRTAEDMAELMRQKGDEVELEELIDHKDRSGKIGYLAAAKDAMRKKETEIDEVKHRPADFDMVILGTPVWAGTIAPAIRTYLKSYGNEMPDVSFFCTHGGGGASKTFRVMEELSDCKPLAVTSIYDKDVKNKKHPDELKAFVDKLP